MLTKLILRNFANHLNLEISFKRFNILYGQNGIGKTNLLESIYFLTSHAFKQKSFFPVFQNNEKDYALITAFFQIANQEVKQRLLVQSQKVDLYHQNQKVDLNTFFGWTSIVYFGEKNNLLNNKKERSFFLHLANRQTKPIYNSFFQQIQQQIEIWKKQLKESKLKNDIYEIEKIKEQEGKIAELFYSVTKANQELISLLNKEIEILIKFSFFFLGFSFRLKLITWENLNVSSPSALFVQRMQKFILNTRLNWLSLKDQFDNFANDFEFCFDFPAKDQYKLSANNYKWVELIVQIALANLLQTKEKKEVIFLFDDFFYFDFINQKRILRSLQNINQIIITTNEIKSVNDYFLKKREDFQVLKIFKDEKL